MEPDDNEIWDKVIAIHVSPSLRKILLLLEKTPLTASELSRQLKVKRVTASTYLYRLRKMGLVVCVTPKRKNYRLYAITSEGKKVLQQLKDYERSLLSLATSQNKGAFLDLE